MHKLNPNTIANSLGVDSRKLLSSFNTIMKVAQSIHEHAEIALTAERAAETVSITHYRNHQAEVAHMDKLNQSIKYRDLLRQLLQVALPIKAGVFFAITDRIYENCLLPEQKEKISSLANELESIPLRMLSGDLDFMEGLDELLRVTKEIGNFMADRANIKFVTLAGGEILKSMMNFGKFLEGLSAKVIGLALPESIQKPALYCVKELIKAYDQTATKVENSAQASANLT